MTSTEFTVGATDRANKVLAFDSAGELAVTQELGTFRGNWSASTAYQVRDLVKDTSTNNIFMANTAHTSSGSQPLTSNTDSAKWDLIVDAATATTSSTSAATSATAAANSATAAASSASAAATSESNASSSASTASTQATNAASSATAAASSATAAAGSASAAEATFDLFDDSYLGSKSSNPTVDNDGNALKDGALYFDTTNNVMKVYDLGTTTWLQLTPTVSNQTNINTLAAISGDVTQAASDSADIQTVASDSADIRALADIEDGTTATNAVSNAGNNATSIVTVAGQISPTNNISSVAAIAADITSVANIDSDVTAVANDATDIGTVATDLAGSDNIGTVATDIVNVNLVGGSIGNVNTVGSNIGTVNEFGERYRVSATAPTTSLDVGDLYYDTTTDAMKVYGSSGWQNAGSSVNGTSQRYNYTATNAQTTFTGADNNGNTLTYDAGYIDVYLNGVKLLNGTDVTVTSGTSVVLASGATTGDVVDIVAYGTFSVASLNADNLDSGTVPTARISGAYTGITQTGTLTSFASTGIDDNATSTAVTIDASGNLLVDKTSTNYQTVGHELRDGGRAFHTADGGKALSLNRLTSNGAIVDFYRFGTEIGNIGTAGSGSFYIAEATYGGLAFSTVGAGDINPCNSDGSARDNAMSLGQPTARFKDAYLSQGVYLGGTGSANKLDDYEEGDWTPTVGGNATYSVQRGRYYKIGNIVVALYQIQIGVLGTGNNEKISGLPFTSENDTNLNVRSGYVSYFANLAVSVGSIATYVENNGTSFYFVSTTGDQVTCNNAPNVLGNSAHIYGTVIYNTA